MTPEASICLLVIAVNLVTPSILITDDDRAFRETLHEVFAPRGFRTLLAEDGQEALDILKQETVHLMLLDMHMPRLTGLDTIRIVRVEFGSVPWILMSAKLDEQLRSQAELAEAASVLSKPVSFRDITTAVHGALQSAYDWQPEN